LLLANVPVEVVTVTNPVVTPLGTVAFRKVPDTTAAVAGIPLKLTVVADVNPYPRIPMVLPTLVQHTNGLLYGDTGGGGIDSRTGVFYSWDAGLPAFVSTVPDVGGEKDVAITAKGKKDALAFPSRQPWKRSSAATGRTAPTYLRDNLSRYDTLMSCR
jgi:hypothetical protein